MKWILGVVALVAVVAVTAVVAVSCSGGQGNNNGGGSAPTSGSNSGIASANDTGPVSVITEDPSCAPWRPINDTLANSMKNGWDKRDPSIPASQWTPEMQAMYQTVGAALRNSADQAVPLIKLTTHRVMRELYQQYVIYSRQFADKVSTYSANDNYLATVGVTAGSVIENICEAISFGSAAARAPLVAAVDSPSNVAPVGDVSNPTQFMSVPNSQCASWRDSVEQMESDPAYVAWNKEDANIPASDWSPQYRSENDAVKTVLTRAADALEKIVRQSGNPVMEDFGLLAAQYGRAYVQGIPTYTNADLKLFNVFRRTQGVVNYACQAAGVN
ncbi:MAG: hypothetical protein P4L86_07290 [Mycobacterium sp.]|nr:hypothetical protein [Mycobacterium sp.]